MCTKCFSTDLEWVKLGGRKELLSYTVIHVSPPQFESTAPYVMGIVKLEERLRLLGMILCVEPEKIGVGMALTVDFDTPMPSQWPLWPRYYFRRP